MSQQIFNQTYDPSKVDAFVLTAANTKRYRLHFKTIGMEFEFVMLAGQEFKITGLASDLEVYMDDVEPEVPGGGLQLVPAVNGGGA